VHELSLCGAIADIATRRAGTRNVTAIHVRIGQLRQVVPETLTFCWELVSADTHLAGAVLEVERVSARLRCHACGVTGPLGESVSLACTSCAALDVEVIAGEELDVTSLDLAAV
jgi:hydrogenase nickel incorporation protein HypA/HybF